MIMLHPIMPFVTEHVWGQIDFINQNNSNKVIHADWPQIVKSKKDENGNINKLIEIISSIRSTRSELNVPPKAMIEIIYDDTQTHLNTIFNQYGSALESIAKIKSVNDFKGDRSEGDIQIIHENEIFYLKLLNIIDFKVESIRLKKNLSKVSSEIEKIRIKLESKNFIENAPEDIIKEQKDRLDEYLSSKLKIEDAINSFSR
jgi:valyl-tRNA synthetase